jgi:hypothetical protein
MCALIPALSAMTWIQVDYCNSLVIPAAGSSECFTSFWITADPGALSVTVSFQTVSGPQFMQVPVTDGYAIANFLVYWKTIVSAPMVVEHFSPAAAAVETPQPGGRPRR